MKFPELKVEAVQFYPGSDHTSQPADATVYPLEMRAMGMAIELARDSLANGDTPVGAVLLNNRTGDTWAQRTTDTSSKNLLDHAEIRVYQMAQPILGDNLRDCSLITTCQPCSSCTPHYAEGRIGRIIYAAPRDYVFPLIGKMRPRKQNMDELLDDGNTLTTVIKHVDAAKSLALFAAYGELRKHKLPKNLGNYLLDIVNDPNKFKD